MALFIRKTIDNNGSVVGARLFEHIVFEMEKYVVFHLALLLISSNPDPVISKICARSVTEFLVPKTEQTHEILEFPRGKLLLITQYSNSNLVKAKIDSFGKITDAQAHLIGNSTSGIHGITLSKSYPGKVWVSLEKANQLLLLDPKPYSLFSAPRTFKIILIPKPGDGPHHIAEYDTNMWTTLKTSLSVLRINHKNYSDYQLYPAMPVPVFLSQHPVSKDIYASEFKTNGIMRITLANNVVSRIEVPSNVGQSPVGLVSSGDYTWVALLSIQSKGKGSFGKIFSNGTAKWFRLRTQIGRKAALLHIAFDPDNMASSKSGLWLLASSVEDPQAADMIIRVDFDKDFEKIVHEEIAFLPAQMIKAHRIIATHAGVYATELTSSRVAFFERTKSSSCDFSFQMVNVDEKDEI